MREYAIFISKIQNFSYLDDPFKPLSKSSNAYNTWVNNIHQKMAKILSKVRFTRVYFGQEFCQRLLPSIKDITLAMERAHKMDMKFTLVTPYVTDEGMAKVKDLLKFFAKQKEGGEVIFNDWGTLWLINREEFNLIPIAGRLIDKMKRDPRFGKKDFEEFFTPQAITMLKKSNIGATAYRQVLNKWGVNRVELDPVPQGFDMNFTKLGVHASVYVPYGYVTFGRVCFIGSLSYPKEDKFKINYECHRECQRYDQYMHKSLVPIPQAVKGSDRLGEIRLIQKGTTVFFINDELDSILEGTDFDRIIYQPKVPI